MLARWAAGSRSVQEPQNTPRTSQLFSSTRLSGSFGICPAAKPTTADLPPIESSITPLITASNACCAPLVMKPRTQDNGAPTTDADPQKRELYDQYGHAGPRQAGFQGFSPDA